MGPEFIGRVIRTSAWVTPLSALFVAVYYNPGFAAAMIVGTAWACANLFLLKHLVKAWIRPGKRDTTRALIFVSIKVPVLYTLGYIALRVDALPVLGLLTGFWIPKGVIVLKVLGVMLSKRLKSGNHASHRSGRRGARSMKNGGVVAFFVLMALSLWTIPQITGDGADALAVSETAVVEQQGHGSDTHAEEQEHGEHQDAHGEAAGHGEQDDHGHEVAGHAEEGHGDGHGEHGEEHHEEHHELPSFITFIIGFVGADTPVGQFLKTWENFIFSFLAVIIIGVLVSAASRRATMVPGPLQNVVEFLVETLEGFICGVLGPHGRKHVWFLGSLFIYILFMNIFGLVPLMKSPTANLNQTLALALCVFLYVQYTGLKNFGIVGYLDHMAGQPRDAISIALVPLMFPLHIIGELAKPMSLSLRLFGNILGEDVLIVIFVGLGVSIMAVMHSPIGIPLHIPFIFLALLTSTIQALVFTLLSTLYFLMMMPHDEH
jgi:F-type H+-transporting ATPase subunit a